MLVATARAWSFRLAVLAEVAALGGCNQLFYFPRQDPSVLERLAGEPLQFRAADGVLLRGQLLRAQSPNPKGTVVHFHGNAGNMESHLPMVQWVTRRGYNLMLFDYRGYGASEGYPEPAGVHLDALAALDFAHASLPQSSPGRDLVVVGHSLGGAIVLKALSDSPTLARVRQVVIESSFHSYSEVASSVTWRHPLLFPLTGVALGAVSDEYSPAGHIAALAPIPVLFVHGLLDQVIPPRFSAALFGLARAPRVLLTIPQVGHQGPMAVCAQKYRDAYLQVIEHSDWSSCPHLSPDVASLCEASSGEIRWRSPRASSR